jgi:hypothetical protein
MRIAQLFLAVLAFPQIACAQEVPQSEPSKAAGSATDDEIFKGAGFEFYEGAWRKCGDPGTTSYEPGAISERGDFNGDGLIDAIVTEGGTFCFGMTGYGYTLVSQRQGGTWRVLDERIGLPRFLEVKGRPSFENSCLASPSFSDGCLVERGFGVLSAGGLPRDMAGSWGRGNAGT